VDLSTLRRRGPLPVRLTGEIHEAPFSSRPCVWFEWIHGPDLDRGHARGEQTDSPIEVHSELGRLTVLPHGLMLHLAPSFEGTIVIEGEERRAREYCLEPERTYHAFTEKLVCHLPPRRFLPFLPRRRTVWLLALSDRPLEGGAPPEPLIPTRRGMTG
jgi:hypothetical protein